AAAGGGGSQSGGTGHGGGSHDGTGGHGSAGSSAVGAVGAAGQAVASPSGHTHGSGRGTALTAPGSSHRSGTATTNLSTPLPGKANPTSGVIPGQGRVGTAPSTPGRHGVGPAGSGVANSSKHVTGAGRRTALTASGSSHRSGTATQRLSTPLPGKANPSNGVMPGQGHLGTVPTTPGHQSP